MGWYADTNWDLDFGSSDDVQRCAEELRSSITRFSFESGSASVDVITLVLQNFGEFSNFIWDDEEVSLYGWTNGKAWDIGLSAEDEGDGVYDILAKYCTGNVDWHSDDDYFWRVRFYGDGRHETYTGMIIYPDER